MPKNIVWLSYDLSVGGDYDGLYAWLDDQGAKECGDSLAFFRFTYRNDLRKELKAAITKAVALRARDRFYVVLEENGEPKGAFLIGRRRTAPWVGHGTIAGEQDDDAG